MPELVAARGAVEFVLKDAGEPADDAQLRAALERTRSPLAATVRARYDDAMPGGGDSSRPKKLDMIAP